MGGCRKGWVNSPAAGGDGLIRGCAFSGADVCLVQNAGGACTCGKDLCNEAGNRFVPYLYFGLSFVPLLF